MDKGLVLATSNPQLSQGEIEPNHQIGYFSAIMKELEKLTLRIDPSSVYFLRFILEGYDNLFLLTTVDKSTGLVEVRAVKKSTGDLLRILESLKHTVSLNHMDPRCTALNQISV